MKAAIRLMCSLGVALGSMFSAHAAITGTVTTIGGSFNDGFVDGNNLVSLFNQPMSVAVDSTGRVLVADYNNNAVRFITTDNVTGTFARQNLSGPSAVAVSAGGDVFVANYTSGTVVRFNRNGDFLGTFASNLASPTALAIDASGNVFVAGQFGGVRRYNSQGGFMQSYVVTQGTPEFRGIALTADGSIAVSDAGNNVIWKFASNGGNPFLAAGTFGVAGFAEGGVGTAKFNAPHQIAAGPGGVLVVADRFNHRVRAVDSSGVVSTLYGVDPAIWEGLPADLLPGWRDGNAADAELREPVGVAVSTTGTVYDSEVFYSLVKKATGLSFPTNNAPGGGGSPSGTSQNRITLGFASGEASSDFLASPGQRFTAPITLDLIPNTAIYGMQFNFTMTNQQGSPAGFYAPAFKSMLMKPREDNPQILTRIDPKLVVRIDKFVVPVQVIVNGVQTTVLVTNYVPAFSNLVTIRATGDFIGVGWLERKSVLGTNLYNTQQQDLIRFSQAHNNTFNGQQGRVIVGAVTVQVPSFAVPGNKYTLRIGRPSANGDGVASDVFIDAPETTSTDVPVAAVRTLTIVAPRKYLVGDVTPFRWFNAGDFGDGNILNNDLQEVQQVFQETPATEPPYGFNIPPVGSDLYDAYDSCCITTNGVNLSSPDMFQFIDGNTINQIGYGDGFITLEDLYVTFRRSLDPSLVNYVRYHNGFNQPIAEVTTNVFRGVAGDSGTSTVKFKKPAFNTARAEEPVTAKFIAGNVKASAGQVVHVPIDLEVTGPLSARSLLLRLQVVPLDNTPALPTSISFTASSEAGIPSTSSQSAPMSYLGIWFEAGSSFGGGTHRVGTVDIAIPATANADAVYTVQIERAEASSGLTRFPTTIANGYVIMSDRAAAPWTDEIPDAWRIQYFGSLMNVLSAPDADADGDGMTTLEEYRAGTNPNDITSRFALNGSNGGASVTLKWPTVAGKSYRLESSTALNGAAWTVVEDSIPGTGGVIQRDQTYDGGQARFYRVHIVE